MFWVSQIATKSYHFSDSSNRLILCDSVIIVVMALMYMQMRAMFVKDSHETPVLSLKWSLNAMKLFSGDSNGLVVCTEIDYDSVGFRP